MTEYLPLLTALITFILTSGFNLLKDKGRLKKENRVFLLPERITAPYDFKFSNIIKQGKKINDINHENHKKNSKELGENYKVDFLHLRNDSNFPVLNVLVEFNNSAEDYNGEGMKRRYTFQRIKPKEEIYIPIGSPRAPTGMTDEDLIVEYSTLENEKFRYEELYKGRKNGYYRALYKYKFKRKKPFIVFEKSNYFSWEILDSEKVSE